MLTARATIAAILLAGCGRIGFRAGSDAPATSGPDGRASGDGGATLDAPDTAGLVAWYPMDQIGATQIDDASGHGHAAVCVAACPVATAGHAAASAARFDGAATYLQVAHAAELDFASGFTIALWAEVDAIPSSGYASLVMRPVGSGNENSFALDVATNGFVEDYSQDGSVYGTTTVTAGAWFHFAVTYDGATKRVYFDGANEGSGPGTSLTFDTDPMLLGADDTGGTIEDYLLGAMADVRLYDRVLSDGELAALAR